jgi:hypothetical protein
VLQEQPASGLEHMPYAFYHRQERIAPAVARVLSAAGITERPPAPLEQQLDVVDVWTGA